MLQRLKNLLLKVEKNSRIGPAIIKFLRKVRFVFYKIYLSLFKGSNNDFDINKILWVSPERINFISAAGADIVLGRGVVKGGDWDKKGRSFSDILEVQAMKERYEDSIAWAETAWYKNMAKKLERGERVRNFNIKKDLDKKTRDIDRLFQSIEENGYRRNQEVSKEYHDSLNTRGPDENYKHLDEILVDIGRDGELLHRDGRHRLAIAKIFDIPRIPVMVGVRHQKWVDFRGELKQYAELTGGALYQPAYHPDLLDISYVYGEERFDLIKDNLGLSSGRVLDIGANFGYFCHKLEAEGFAPTAVEVNPQEVYFMKKLRDINGDSFKVVESSVFDFRSGEKLAFDVVLALFIFHHFLKREETFESLKKFLQRLECKEMYFGTHSGLEDSGLEGAYINYDPDEFAQFVLDNTSLNQKTLIKELDGGRRLYKLYK